MSTQDIHDVRNNLLWILKKKVYTSYVCDVNHAFIYAENMLTQFYYLCPVLWWFFWKLDGTVFKSCCESKIHVHPLKKRHKKLAPVSLLRADRNF